MTYIYSWQSIKCKSGQALGVVNDLYFLFEKTKRKPRTSVGEDVI